MLHKRDTANPIGALEGEGPAKPAASTTPAANTTLTDRGEFEGNLKVFNAIQQRLITLAFPVINGIANSTNDTMVHNVVWQAFAEIIAAPLNFKSPFKLGGNYILTVEKQLFNGSSANSTYAKPNRTAHEDKLLDYVEDLDSLYIFYSTAYWNATAAANVTGLLPKFDKIQGYLLPKNQSIMTEAFRDTVDNYWMDKLFPNGVYSYSNSSASTSVFAANSTTQH